MPLKKILLFLLIICSAQNLCAQYPSYFTYDDQNGLPSNEVYSIVQDDKGFIWIGCDAGLFKFDGIRYTRCKSPAQTSKAVTNLTLYGKRIYCTNFQNQIFYVEDEVLKELPHAYSKVSGLSVDMQGNLYLTHGGGMSVYDAKEQQWHTLNEISEFTRSVVITAANEVYFLNQAGIAKISGGDVRRASTEKPESHKLPGNDKSVASNHLLTIHKDEVWIFSRVDNTFFTYKNGRFTQNPGSQLFRALQSRKITTAKSLSDGNIWISTYKGIICYNSQNDSAQVFYPELSFSDVMIDREGNYWFTTLQAGMLRVPDLNYVVWNGSNENIKNEKLTRIATDKTNIYFSSVSGHIGQLNTKDHTLKSFHTGNNADVESFDYDVVDGCLYFYSQNESYILHQKKIAKAPFIASATKVILHVPPFYFCGSSHGLYVKTSDRIEKINEAWSRQLLFDSLQNQVWAASNSGLLRFQLKRNHWTCIDTLFEKTQILSIDMDKEQQRVFALSFDGKIFRIDMDNQIRGLTQLPENVQGGKLKFYKNKIYLATNKGVGVVELESNKLTMLNRMSGLTSDNVQDLLLLDNVLWLATGRGLQKIPINDEREKQLANVYLKTPVNSNVQLSYGQPLVLQPEASIYSANGNFEYAYRIGNNDWIKLPATIEQIEIPNLPTGKVDIELKVIDHVGRDSENIILISGLVRPPFWKTWWFIFLVVFGLVVMTLLIVKRIIGDIRRREREKSELLNSQLKAIRAQMNPHFMYNTLNSIQDLILEQDIKSTNYYLSRFSQLMRQILEFSEEEKILLSEETDMLHNYLELEKLRFGDEFSFVISMDEKIDANLTYLPGLIVQPFVENAIKHGLLHKKGMKKLVVHFSLEDKVLGVLIEDDGVGRKRSAEIKERSSFVHKSFASHAVQKRVDLLNKSSEHHITIEVNDVLKNEENTGTRVMIRFSLQSNVKAGSLSGKLREEKYTS